MEKEESLGKREKERSDEEVRKKIYKIIYTATVTMYLQTYTTTDVGSFWRGKCVNLIAFCIIHTGVSNFDSVRDQVCFNRFISKTV